MRTIAPEENCLPVRARVRVRVNFRVGGQSSGAIVLEPLKLSCKPLAFVSYKVPFLTKRGLELASLPHFQREF